MKKYKYQLVLYMYATSSQVIKKFKTKKKAKKYMKQNYSQRDLYSFVEIEKVR